MSKLQEITADVDQILQKHGLKNVLLGCYIQVRKAYEQQGGTHPGWLKECLKPLETFLFMYDRRYDLWPDELDSELMDEEGNV